MSYAFSLIVIVTVGILQAKRFSDITIIIIFIAFLIKRGGMIHMGVVVIGRVGWGWDREKCSLFTHPDIRRLNPGACLYTRFAVCCAWQPQRQAVFT